jgi:F-type H+-transporting ATPase subunit b
MIPDMSALWVVFFLLLCTVLLNTLVFKPVLAVIDRRATAVREARELAESASQKATQASDEYDRRLNEARGEVYRQIDETRRAALERRAARLSGTRATLEAEARAATARVRDEAAAARAALDREASELAGAVVARVLGRAS